LALDLSAATGKPLETIANALGRAYDGNTTALGKLGLGLDADIIKSKDFDAIFKELTGTFGNFAEKESETTAKQLERVKIALDEAKESIGAALLPVVQELTAWILDNFIPALEAFISGLTGEDSLEASLSETQVRAVEWGKKIRGLIDTVIKFKDELIILSGILATLFVVSKISAGVTATIVLINLLIKAYNALKASAIVAGVAVAFAANPLLGVGAVALAAAVLSGANALARKEDTAEVATGTSYNEQRMLDIASGTGSSGVITGGGLTGGSSGLSGGSAGKPATISKPTQTLIEQVSEANFIKRTAGTGSFDLAGFRAGEEKDRIIINVNAPSAIDEEGFSRAVVSALNTSNSRNGGGSATFRGIVAE
jgi:hypothetical protein